MSGAIGSFTYGLSGVIDLGVVTTLLVGSAVFVTLVILYYAASAIRDDPTVPRVTPERRD